MPYSIDNINDSRFLADLLEWRAIVMIGQHEILCIVFRQNNYANVNLAEENSTSHLRVRQKSFYFNIRYCHITMGSVNLALLFLVYSRLLVDIFTLIILIISSRPFLSQLSANPQWENTLSQTNPLKNSERVKTVPTFIEFYSINKPTLTGGIYFIGYFEIWFK